MDNTSVFCENLDLKNLISNTNGVAELTEEGKQRASSFSEGNKYLYDALASCWKHGIKTFASCSGHEGKADDYDTNYQPYIGLVLDNNSLPYVRNIIANLQHTDDVWMSFGFTQKEDDWGPEVPDYYKSFRVYCGLPNRCEVFYKIHEALESRNMDTIPLSQSDKSGTSSAEFYDKAKEFCEKTYSNEDAKQFGSYSYDNCSKELLMIQWQRTWWQKLKEENKLVGRIVGMFSRKEKKRLLAIEKYKVAQVEYTPPLFSKLNNSYYNSEDANHVTPVKPKAQNYEHSQSDDLEH